MAHAFADLVAQAALDQRVQTLGHGGVAGRPDSLVQIGADLRQRAPNFLADALGQVSLDLGLHGLAQVAQNHVAQPLLQFGGDAVGQRRVHLGLGDRGQRRQDVGTKAFCVTGQVCAKSISRCVQSGLDLRRAGQKILTQAFALRRQFGAQMLRSQDQIVAQRPVPVGHVRRKGACRAGKLVCGHEGASELIAQRL